LVHVGEPLALGPAKLGARRAGRLILVLAVGLILVCRLKRKRFVCCLGINLPSLVLPPQMVATHVTPPEPENKAVLLTIPA